MSELAERLAEQLALEVVDHVDATGDEDAITAMSKTMGDTSQTLQEAFITAVRVIRAERRARTLMQNRIAAEGAE